MTDTEALLARLHEAIARTRKQYAEWTPESYPLTKLDYLSVLEAEAIASELKELRMQIRVERGYAEMKEAELERVRAELDKAEQERMGWHGRALDAEQHKFLAQARLDRAVKALRARCFLCADGIPRRECEPMEAYNRTITGLHSWRGNDRMECGLTSEEASIVAEIEESS
jgi:uncharacterized secreted protein with C-terminal beta-propeller domain